MSCTASPFVIAIDWGTTNLRLWLLSDAGEILAHKTSDKGMSQLQKSDYPDVLNDLIDDLSVARDVPVIICGMAGAASGWQDAGYAVVPLYLEEMASHVTKVSGQTRDIRIIKGLSYQNHRVADVMRGEETLLYGLYLAGIDSELICLPGTHAKWVSMHKGQISDFATTMTGELFHLLSTQSVLSSALSDITTESEQIKAFQQGLDEISKQSDCLTKLLFAVRANGVLSPGSARASKAYLSGLLIGSDIIANHISGQSVTLVSSGDMARLYADAFNYFNISYEQVDAHDMAVVALHKMAKEIWDNKDDR